MSEKRTHRWAPTQAVQAGNLVAAALAPTLEHAEPSMTLRRVQTNQRLYAQMIQEAHQRFMASFATPFKRDQTEEGWELVVPNDQCESGWSPDPSAYGPVVPDGLDPARIAEQFQMIELVGPGRLLNGTYCYALIQGLGGSADGQFLAEWFIDNQDHIPEHWRERAFVFAGTTWRMWSFETISSIFVPSIEWLNGRWMLFFRPLNSSWDEKHVLLRPKHLQS